MSLWYQWWSDWFPHGCGHYLRGVAVHSLCLDGLASAPVAESKKINHIFCISTDNNDIP